MVGRSVRPRQEENRPETALKATVARAGSAARPGPEARPGLEAHFTIRRSGTFTLELDLAIPAGRTVALLGPNGAGKSTAVAAIAGLLAVDSGRIELAATILDEPARALLVPPEERRIGVVFQDLLLFPHLSAEENVAFGPRSRGAGLDEARARAREWLGRVGMEGLSGRKPGELSGGQAQRIALARALATEPDLLLLDEPLAALDVSSRADVRRVLAEHLADFRGPRLLITHDPAEAFELADHIHVVEKGRVTQRGSADDIRMRPRTPYTAELGGSNLLSGTAEAGLVETGELSLAIADPDIRGPVRLAIRPTAVSVHRERPGGSPRNRWRTVVEELQDTGFRVRLLTGPPLPLTIDVTQAARRELDLDPGSEIWLSVKATDIGVEAEQEEST